MEPVSNEIIDLRAGSVELKLQGTLVNLCRQIYALLESRSHGVAGFAKHAGNPGNRVFKNLDAHEDHLALALKSLETDNTTVASIVSWP